RRTGCESRAWACGGATASGRPQSRDGANSRGATFVPCCRLRRFCRASSPCRGRRAPCDGASRAGAANSRGWRWACVPPILFSLWPLLLHHLDQMPDLVNHTADRRRVLALDHLVHSAKPEAADGLPHVIGAADEADHPLDFEGAGFSGGFLLLRAHELLSVAATFSFSRAGLPLISSTVLERVSATWAASFKLSSAANVALITLCGLEVPSDFVSTLVMPATCITLRTGPPAMTPVPSEAGLSSTCAEP